MICTTMHLPKDGAQEMKKFLKEVQKECNIHIRVMHTTCKAYSPVIQHMAEV